MNPIPNLTVVQGKATAPRPARVNALDVLNHVLAQPSLRRAATALATRLAREFACEHVAVGVVRRNGVRVLGWSGTAELRQEFQLVRQVAAAMDEAVDQHAILRFPLETSDAPRITLAHGELSAAHTGAAVCSVPVVAEQKVYGAVTLLRGAGSPWSREDLIELECLLGILGPVLDLKQRSRESSLRRLLRETASFSRHLFGRGHWRHKVGAAAAVLALALATLVPVNVTVSADARLEGEIQRSLSAPLDSFIKEVFVRPGDTVKSGQPLLTLSDQDLRTNQRRIESELARYRGEYAEAFARQDRSKMITSQARMQESDAALALVEEQLARTTVNAPFDGIVIAGDLTQQIGAPIKRGDVLLALAPNSNYRIVLAVEDRDIGRLRAGMRGELTLAALPAHSLSLEVTRITPVARVLEGRNVFEVEASLIATQAGLRPGLEGVARVNVGRDSLAAVVGGRFIDWLRFKLWTWWG